MKRDWDIYGETTDTWGYSRYSLVMHAPDAFNERVSGFRQAIGMGDLTATPHISLCAGMYLPDDLNALTSEIGSLIARTGTVPVRLADNPVLHKGNDGWLVVEPTAPLLALRQSLVSLLGGKIGFAAGPEKPFRPHITLYLNASDQEASRARNIAAASKFGTGFVAGSVDLVGRVGPARGGQREIINRFGFMT